MAESSTSALPGDIEWLPGPGGARRLRVTPPLADPPVLVLRATGGEERIPARPGPHTEFEIPASLDWSAAWLQWPDGTRAAVEPPHGRVIELRPRREPAPSVERWPVDWTTPPGMEERDDAAGAWRARQAELERELSAAASAITRAREGERAARDAVLSALAAARADLRAVRAAREADRSAYEALSGELAAERAAHAVTRGSIGTLADALAAARAELAEAREAASAAERDRVEARAEAASLRAALEKERAARRAAETSLRELQDRTGVLARIAQLDAERGGDLASRAREQAKAAAAAAHRPREQAQRLLADLDAAAAALRAATAPREDAEPAAGEAAPGADAPAGDATPPAPRAAASAPREDAEPAAGEAASGADAPAGAATPPAPRAAATAGDATPPAPGAAASAGAAPADDATPPAPDAGEPAHAASSSAAALAGSADASPPAVTGDATTAPSAGDAGPAAGGATTPEPPGDGEPARASSPAAPATLATPAGDASPPAATEPAPTTTSLVPATDERRLRRALVALAHDDPEAAGALLAALLPAQAAVLDAELTYDLTIRGVGTFAVTLGNGSAAVTRLAQRRRRKETDFHLAADPRALAELLAGERHKLRRLGRKARLTGRSRKRAQELRALPHTNLTLAQAARAGATLEPSLVYRALPYAIEPEWTKGHRFTVAQRIEERAWYISARDGERIQVIERSEQHPADATVTMTRTAFDRLLRDEPQPFGERPTVRGDREAVQTLKAWTDRATKR